MSAPNLTPSELAELKRLEGVARELEPDETKYRGWLEAMARYAADFRRWLPESPVRREDPDKSALRESLPSSPISFEAALGILDAHVLKDGLNAASANYMSFVPPGGLPAAAVGDFLSALTNRYSGSYGACPGAVEIENATIRWLMEMVGFPKSGWGVLHSGGTLAALSALVCARDTRPASEWAKGVIYRTTEAHHSISKMLHVAGLKECEQRLVPTDDTFRMSVSHLKALIEKDRAAGLVPWILCITAGTTNTGAVDPLADLVALGHENGMWVHVDGAYGGFFALTERAGTSLASIRDADSLVLDPHKGLFLPYGCGAVLVRDRKHLFSAFSSRPAYLADLAGHEEPSPSDYSPEGTRHFRALRLWLSLKLHGVEPFRAALTEKLLLARLAHEKLREIPGLEMGPEPQLSCVLFRVRGEDDSKTETLLSAIHKSNTFICNSTRLSDKLYVRLCILNFRTHQKEVLAAVDTVRSLALK